MNYTHNLSSCFCTTAASGYPTGSGSFLKAQLSGTFGVSSSGTLGSGVLHTSIYKCESLTSTSSLLFDVENLSPPEQPNSTYRILINVNDLDDPPVIGDEFIVINVGGISYVYNVSAVSIV